MVHGVNVYIDQLPCPAHRAFQEDIRQLRMICKFIPLINNFFMILIVYQISLTVIHKTCSNTHRDLVFPSNQDNLSVVMTLTPDRAFNNRSFIQLLSSGLKQRLLQ